MAVETSATTIKDLNPNWPLPDDYISEGDDHIKIVKQTLQNTFTDVDEPLTAPLSKLNDLDSYMDFRTTSQGGTDVKQLVLQGVQVTGALPATATDGLVTLQQLTQMISNAVQQGVYRVGSYYFTDENTNPRTILGFGTWTRVAGFLVGAGELPGGNGVGNRTLSVGDTGGGHAAKLTEAVIPRVGSSVSGTTGGGGRHRHDAGTDGMYRDDPTRSGIVHWPGGEQHRDGNPVTEWVNDHTHPFSANFAIGHDDPAALDNMPPFTTTNIWKRIV